MKYYDQLKNLETELIRLDTLSSLVSVITAGFENSANYKDLQNSMYHIEDSLKSMNENLRREFDDLWEVIREDEMIDDSEKDYEYYENDGVVEYDVFTDDKDIGNITLENVNYDYNFEPLDTVMNTWSK